MNVRHKSRIILAVLAVVAGVIGFVALRTPKEPEYQGKTFGEWMKDREVSRGLSEKGWQAVHHIGTNGIPYLLNEIRCKDSRVALALVDLAKKQHFVKVHFKPAVVRHAQAIDEFRYLAWENRSASIQALAQFLDDPELNVSVLITLSDIVKGSLKSPELDVLPLLARSMTNGNPETSIAVIKGLDSFVPNKTILLPTLIACLKDANPRVRDTAVKALEFYNNCPEMVIPALLKTIRDPNAQVRGTTAIALGRFSDLPEKVVPALVKSLQDESADVRSLSAYGLQSLGQPAACKQAVPFLVKALNDPDEYVRTAAERALSFIAPKTLKKH